MTHLLSRERYLELFESLGVLQRGHIVLDCGKHANLYVNKDALSLHPTVLNALCYQIAMANTWNRVQAVVGPAIGGALVAQIVASHLDRHGGTVANIILGERPSSGVIAAFADKTPGGLYVLRRGYDKAIRGLRTLIVDDVMTSGESVRWTALAAAAAGADVIGAYVMVNRGAATAAEIDVPILGQLLTLDVQPGRFPEDRVVGSWDEAQCPMCAQGIPIRIDIGKGEQYLERKQHLARKAQERRQDEADALLPRTPEPPQSK